MLSSVNLGDYMLDIPATITADGSLMDAVHKILALEISGLCVIDEKKILLGVLSELDCLRGILSATYNHSGVGSAADYMTRDVDVVSLKDDIINVANDMMYKGQQRRPVTENGKLVG